HEVLRGRGQTPAVGAEHDVSGLVAMALQGEGRGSRNHWPSWFDVPDPDELLIADTGKPLAVRAERYAPNLARGHSARAQQPPAPGFPDVDGAVRAGTRESSPVRTVGHAADAALVACQSPVLLTTLAVLERAAVPDANGPVIAGGYQLMAVGAER